MTTSRFWKTMASVLLVFATVAMSSACAAPRGRIYVRVGPPAPIVEAQIVAPGPGYHWVPGFHMWNGSEYVWVRGHWDRPPRVRAIWVAGRWVHDRRHGWYFVEGHWR